MPHAFITSIGSLIKRLPVYFWAVWLVLLVTIGVFLADVWKVSQAEAILIVLEESEHQVAVEQPIVETIAGLTGTLAFYDEVLRATPDIVDPWAEAAPSERVSAWRRYVTVERKGSSQLLYLRVSGRDAESARALAQGATTALYQLTSRYYHPDKVTVRLVDEPIVFTHLSNWPLWLITSVGMATIGAWLLFYAVDFFKQFFLARSKRAQAIRSKLTQASPRGHLVWTPISEGQAFRSQAPTSHEPAMLRPEQVPVPMASDTAPTFPSRLPDETRQTLSPSARLLQAHTRAAAPTNLPLGDEMPDWLEGAWPDRGASAVEQSTPALPVNQGEPTEEEYKRRLNQLLKGKL